MGRLDPALTELGELQAIAAGRRIGDVHELRASPLIRARRTADLLGLEAPVLVDERFIELDYGELDGTPHADVDRSLWEQWLSDVDFSPPGGESLSALGRRVEAAMAELFETPGAGARVAGSDVVIVSHVSPIKAAVAWALGVDHLTAWRMRLSNGSVTRIAMGPHGPQLLSFNETPPPARS